MRAAIVSRIFMPEPSAASFRLEALARSLANGGNDVQVLTAKPPAQLAEAAKKRTTYEIRRMPVLRDKTGYVRGYVQYMSFDIPLFFRLLFGRKHDVIVSEPPPTTGFFVRLACGLRRIPYVYYAADIWSDASESTGVSSVVVSVVRGLERFALNGAAAVLSVNNGVTTRVKEIAPAARVYTVGNGIDTEVFRAAGPKVGDVPFFLYAGTASEWQGAEVFIEAFGELLQDHPEARLIFLGQGSDWRALQERAAKLPDGAVQFIPTVPPDQAAARMRGATATLASIRPDSGYSYALPTKVFASWATGTPVIFAGEGPVVEFMETHQAAGELGASCDYDAVEVLSAMRRLLGAQADTASREALGHWAANNVSLRAVADCASSVLIGLNKERDS